jgi:hypothetical protein
MVPGPAAGAPMILNLGVLDVTYSDANGGTGATSTGDVAEILEKNYGVMATFFASRKDKIAQVLADGVAAAIQDLVNGAPPRSPTFGAEQKIEALFRAFIFSDEMATLHRALEGTELSAAAAAGVNHRKKHPYAKANKARPAFVDTGLFVNSFRAWISSADS